MALGQTQPVSILIGILPVVSHAVIAVSLIGIGVVSIALVVAGQTSLEVTLTAKGELLLAIQVVMAPHVRHLQGVLC